MDVLDAAGLYFLTALLCLGKNNLMKISQEQLHLCYLQISLAYFFVNYSYNKYIFCIFSMLMRMLISVNISIKYFHENRTFSCFFSILGKDCVYHVDRICLFFQFICLHRCSWGWLGCYFHIKYKKKALWWKLKIC